MSKSNKLETELLQLIFETGSITLPASNVYIALHTADPGEDGTQQTNEATYTSYARVAVSRTTGWTVTGDTANPNADITFPQATGGSETITHFSIGQAASGASDILYYGVVTPNIAVTNGVTPSLTTATAVSED